MVQRSFTNPMIQGSFGDGSEADGRTSGPVECLGMTFENDEARRTYFLDKLREKLGDPEFRKIEGFPIGKDEDILALSDPPYYTACPNPFIGDFVRHYGRPYDPNEHYHREPYAAELAESRNNPFVNAHSYATKAPHQAIMRLLLHYTKPGDLVLDAFGGTGMTAVAAQLCAAPDDEFRQLVEKELPDALWGPRTAIVGDLSPAATFIARNFNLPDDMRAFRKEAQALLEEVEDECGWMYRTRHTNGDYGEIVCTIWSDVFVCPNCASEIVFWDAAVNTALGKIEDQVPCIQCGARCVKGRLERAWTVTSDVAFGHPIKLPKQVPVLILYEYGRIRYEKKPDAEDIDLLNEVEQRSIPEWFPTDRMPVGEESRRNDDIGLTHIHHFFTKRELC